MSAVPTIQAASSQPHQAVGGGHEEADVGEEPARHPRRERHAEGGPAHRHHERARHQGDEDAVDDRVARQDDAVAERHRPVLEDAAGRGGPQEQHAHDHDGEGVDHRLRVDPGVVEAVAHDHHEHAEGEADVAQVVEDVGHRDVGGGAVQVVGLVDRLGDEGGDEAAGDQQRHETVPRRGAPRAPAGHAGGACHHGQVGEGPEAAGRLHDVDRGEHGGGSPQQDDGAGRGRAQDDLLLLGVRWAWCSHRPLTGRT